MRLSPPRAAHGPARLLVAARVFLTRARGPFSSRVRQLAAAVLLLLGLVVQVILLVLLGELVDLCISLAELWAELARKHLELTV